MQWRRGLIGCSTLLVCLVFATVTVTLTALLPGPAWRYYLLLPGEAFPVGPRIRVPDNLRKESGQLSFTVVYERAASLPDALVALRAAGYEVKIGGDGVRITGTAPGTPASQNLQRGDVVLGIDGQRTGTATELIEAIRRHQPGDTVELRVR